MSESNAHTTVLPFDAAPARSGAKARIFGVEMDVVTPDLAVGRILSWCQRDERHIVVTPNVDHCIALRSNEALRAVYRRAGLVVPDGMPLIWASRLGGPRLEQRVTGSDLIVPLCRAAAAQGRSVFLLGSAFETLTEAARRLAGLAPGLAIAGVYSPPYGAAFDEAENERVVTAINSAAPDIVFVALGMPKQELWAGHNLHRLRTHAAVCIGAGLDYLAGTVRRAPPAWQRAGLEWLWRAATDPARLGPRYARNLTWLPLLMAEQALASYRGQL